MKRYLQVNIEGPKVGDDVSLFQELEEGCEYKDAELLQIGQDMVNEHYSWGIVLVNVEDVPEGER